jgi:hypothetical protein
MTEYDLQRFVIQYLKLNAVRGLIYYHCPNGESRSPRTGAKLKAMGVRPGVADICMTLPGGSSAYLELKGPKGRSSPEQRIFRADCETIGARYEVASSTDEVMAILSRWGAVRTAARAA